MDAHVTLFGSTTDETKVQLMGPEYEGIAGMLLVQLGTLRVYLPQDLARRLVAEVTAVLPAEGAADLVAVAGGLGAQEKAS